MAATICPSAKIIIFSQVAKRKSKSWEAIILAVLIVFKVLINCLRIRGSRKVVGSSKSRKSGRMAKTAAIAARLFSPPESW